MIQASGKQNLPVKAISSRPKAVNARQSSQSDINLDLKSGEFEVKPTPKETLQITKGEILHEPEKPKKPHTTEHVEE